MSLIRKLSLGTSFPNDSIHYQVGKTVKLNGGYLPVSMILELPSEKKNVREFEIYLKDDGVNVLWKTVSGIPVVVEYNIDFE